MKKAGEQSAWLTVSAWLLLSMGSLVMGYLLLRTLMDPFGGKGNPIAGSVLALIVLGFMLPTAQGIVVRQWLPDARYWLVASFGGVLVVAGLDLVISSYGFDLVQAVSYRGMTLGFGLLVGSAQWIYLRRHLPDAARWIVASALGWGAMSLITGPVIDELVEGLLYGLIPATFTGIAFVVLVRGRAFEAAGADAAAI